MFRYMLGGGDVQTYVISMLLALPIILLSLSLHETAHGYAALKMGDPTARNLGRLSLNPLRHLDPVGFLCMLLAGFGWANPVPINSRNFRNPRKGLAVTALAGPASNLLLALLFLLLLRFLGFGLLWNLAYPSEFAARMAYFFVLFLYYGIQLNLTLAVFNLLPIPPLDGSRILSLMLPPRLLYKYMRYQRQISLIVMLLLLLGPLSSLIQAITSLLMRDMFAMVGMSGFLIF